MNTKIIKLIKMLREKKGVDVFYVKAESYDLSTDKVVTQHIFEGFKGGKVVDTYETSTEDLAIQTLIRTYLL